MPKNRNNGANDTDVLIQESGAEVASDSNGYNPPPYTAQWVTIRDAAVLAGVTSQTVRNAYKGHEAFNPQSLNGGPDNAQPAWFTTKMKDQFGNITDFDVVYLDRAAVERWIDARAAKPAPAQHGGAKRYIIRLTAEQVAALPSEEGTMPSIALPDGTLVQLEKPPVGNRKKDNATTTDATDNPEDGVAADMPNVQQTADLFDVELEEVPA